MRRSASTLLVLTAVVHGFVAPAARRATTPRQQQQAQPPRRWAAAAQPQSTTTSNNNNKKKNWQQAVGKRLVDLIPKKKKKKRRTPRAGLVAAAAFSLLAFGGRAVAAQGGGPFGDVGRQVLEAGARRDSLTLLLATATVIPLAKAVGLSPILGFLLTGVALGPNGLGAVTELSATEALAEIGVVFFLFEMGLELSMERLGAMKREIFGLGLAQFVVTTLVVAKLAHFLSGGSIGAVASGLVGGALALSSSAFVLQLLRDQDELGTAHGRASLGVLLLQDLAVVPLLVVTPLLAAGGGGLAGALAVAAAKAVFAVVAVEYLGKKVLDRAFDRAARSGCQEAFLSVVFLAAIGVSAFTESLGLSETLGAFLAGVSLSETKYSYKVEADVAPFRGMLLGLFFVTVGFEIDVNLIAAKPLLVSSLAAGILALKAALLGALGLAFRLPLSSAIRSGCLLAQGGEFGFVAFGLANRLGLLGAEITKLLLTVVALSMAATPVVAGIGNAVARFLDADDRETAASKLKTTTTNATTTTTADECATLNNLAVQAVDRSTEPVVVVCGYGQLGRVVCETLDAKLQRYVVIEKDATKASIARRDGRPVYRGDLTDADTLAKFRVPDARLAVVAIDGDRAAINNVVVALRSANPDLKVVSRALDATHMRLLRRIHDNIVPLVPTLRDDSKLLTLPFGGAVLRGLGFRADDVDMLIEDKRRDILGTVYPYAPQVPAPPAEDLLAKAPAILRAEKDQDEADLEDDDAPKSLMAQCLSADANADAAENNATTTLLQIDSTPDIDRLVRQIDNKNDTAVPSL
ncbi:hypothetical protein CTAYLR_002386 [Chrysophaeum taylorii]|uniref:RCK N-terminal domain-containing protein n=1 Tax=Chrysophaeum taylorii TaxID=2483200 RepID=A0AAD7UI79_9STRA|nr:hypothetical protein CTAYLR_002386 [Chrysophaeum taylorii]